MRRPDPKLFDGDTTYWLDRDPGDSNGGARNSITEKEGSILAGLAEGLAVCEIGTGTGFSALCMARTASRVTTIDICPFVEKEVWPELREAGIACQSFRPMDRFDMIFIDGDHSALSVGRDLEWAAQCTDLIVCHDLHLACSGPAIRQWCKTHSWKLEDLKTVQGLCALRR